jgi:hypothetical protein
MVAHTTELKHTSWPQRADSTLYARRHCSRSLLSLLCMHMCICLLYFRVRGVRFCNHMICIITTPACALSTCWLRTCQAVIRRLTPVAWLFGRTMSAAVASSMAITWPPIHSHSADCAIGEGMCVSLKHGLIIVSQSLVPLS